MTKRDIITVFCHQTCEELKIDKGNRYKFFSYFYSWTFENYSDVDQRIDELRSELAAKGLSACRYDLVNTYFSDKELGELYERVFTFLSTQGRYKNAPVVLNSLESNLNIQEHKIQFIKNKYIELKYYQDASLMDYAQSVISFLMISYSNDTVLDKSELQTCKGLFSGLLDKCEEFPIRSFDFVHALKCTQVPVKELRELRSELIQAANSDGVVEKKELRALKTMTSLIGVDSLSDRNIERIEPFCALAILISDGQLSTSEINWFLEKYDVDTVINNIEDVFWLFSILTSNEQIIKDNQWFISMLWNAEKPFYDLANGLYLAFYKNFYKGSRSIFNTISRFMLAESSLDFKLTIDKLNRGDVVKEEILLSLNLIFNSRYSEETINQYLSLSHSREIFDSIKNEYSPLVYFAIVNALFTDGIMDINEYEVLWSNFQDLKIDSIKLGEVIYDYSLLKSKGFVFDEYFTYLRKNQL